jgi:NADH-quinone oxidoreductase subunit E
MEMHHAAMTPDETARLEQGIAKVLERYPADRKPAAMLPALRLLQEIKGWLVPDGVKQVAKLLGTTPERAHEVATFYIMFFTEKPGRYVIDVCTNLPCALRGAEGMLKHLETKLGTLAGTNGDKFYLRETECLASCGTAPCMQVNEDHHENLTKAKVDAILEKLT